MKQSDHKDEAKTETPSPPKSQTNTPEEVATEDPLLNAVQLFEKEQSMIEDWVDTEVYFGSVRSVAEGSVAESCGIEDCDRLIAFGDITVDSFHDLKQLADYFERARGSRIEVVCCEGVSCRSWLDGTREGITRRGICLWTYRRIQISGLGGALLRV